MAMLERMTLVGKRPDWCACVTQCAQIDANSGEAVRGFRVAPRAVVSCQMRILESGCALVS